MPDPTATPTEIHVHTPNSNSLATAGLIVSIVGLFTAGILSPIGLLMSIFAFFKPPRGMAVAGIVIGGLGTVVLLVLIAMIAIPILLAIAANA